MGQDLKYLVTTEELGVPIFIVHFKERNATIFPILIEDGTYGAMSDYSKESAGNISNFFYEILRGGYELEYPTRRLFYFIAASNVKSLAMISYREFADIPQDIGMPILFVEDKIIDLTKEEMSEDRIHERIGAAISFSEIINNEERYWGYESAERSYLENLKNYHKK